MGLSQSEKSITGNFPFDVTLDFPPDGDFYVFLRHCVLLLNKRDMEKFLVLLWRIWYRRNKIIHDNRVLNDEGILGWSLDFYQRYFEANGLPVHVVKLGRGPNSIPVTIPWRSPAMGKVKLNCDASLDVVGMKIGCGAVVHDSSDFSLASTAVPFSSSMAAPVAEAMAILQGLLLCYRLGYHHVEVETDCKRVCQALSSKTPLVAEFGTVILDCLSLCNSIDVISFSGVPIN
ncbi:uncharacterized protein LOC133780011 [Humulus lupulus]|uniref:uncharacterized protein LOC133780011 n=1 Tax=Humulus lupulus TaxID=3486 RepID=UPI002B40AFB6|nr:uncharacterized protein LOC133780011 [Humulus lupulus]